MKTSLLRLGVLLGCLAIVVAWSLPASAQQCTPSKYGATD